MDERLPDEQITALIEWAKRRMEFEDFQVDNGIQRHADAIHAQRVYVALSSIPALLAHADALAARVAELEAAQAEDLVRLRIDHSRLQVVLWTLLNELSPGVVEELRAVWGNTNTRILEDRIEDARRALEGGPRWLRTHSRGNTG